ncbi:hypothetical protein ABK040_002961 [Willaertia magna]
MNQSQQQSDVNDNNLNFLTHEQQHVIHEDDNVHFELENFTIQHLIHYYNINNEDNDDIGFLLDESNTAIYEEDFYQSPSNTNPTPNQAKQQINLIKKDGRFVQKEIKPHIKPKEYDHLVSKFKFK